VEKHDIVVIGASAGGLTALQEFIAALPADLSAAFFVVLHMPAGWKTHIPELLTEPGKLAVKLAEDGAPVRAGTLLLAPPDHHLILKDGYVKVTHGPRENFWRPSIDVLFRSAAVAYGPRVIGIIMSGLLDDGTAGLVAIKRCGGTALVQNPEEALNSDMPRSALRNVADAQVLSTTELAATVAKLALEPAGAARSIPADLLQEARIAEEANLPDLEVEQRGELTSNICPECGGPLRKQQDDPLMFRCRTGHAFSIRALLHGTAAEIEQSLWTAVRLFQQRCNLARELAEKEQARGRQHGAETYRARASEAAAHATALRELLAHLQT
jgi:two-component system, chemotaxis family, protein-glutamate methylesterase/glutaminase